MSVPSRIVLYSVAFLAIAALARFFGLTDMTFNLSLTISLIFCGMGIFIFYYGTHKTTQLFVSSLVFFAGLLIFVFDNFVLDSFSAIILPSVLLMLGFSLLIVFIEDTRKVKLLIPAVVFLLFPLIIALYKGTFVFDEFFSAIGEILSLIWVMIALIGLVLFFIYATGKKN
ncbi:MAG: hypothetical protein HUU54_15275 [Ignavibacteriaceae bacterium]|nr:hypothetical protein [Ignavibacteriaceae bacterium]